MARPSFRDRVPGDCCCNVPTGVYDWYRDTTEGATATSGTQYFIRVPSVVLKEMNQDYNPAWQGNPSTNYWNITGSIPKFVDATMAAGYQSPQSEDEDSELVFSQEINGVEYYLKLYDCIAQEELDSYHYVLEGCDESPDVDDYSNSYPAVMSTMNIYNTYNGIGGGTREGVGIGYSSIIRGILAWDTSETESPGSPSGYLIEYEYDPVTSHQITKSVCVFNTSGFYLGEATEVIVPGSVTGITYYTTPQAVAPRNWPNAAGVKHVIYIYTTGPETPTGCDEYTIYPQASLYVGDLSCNSETHTLSLTDETENLIFKEEDVGGLTGPIRYLLQLAERHKVDVQMFDSSPGGSIVLARYQWTSGDPESASCPADASIDTDDYFYVRLYIGSTMVDEYQTTIDWYHPWGESCHAVQHHPDDPYWLFCIPSGQVDEFDPNNFTNFRICCYKSDGSKYWETVQSENTAENGPPIVLWSSDRWIYVSNLILSTGNIYEVTRHIWDVDATHSEWLLSHNPESVTGEYPEIPIYIPAGTRSNSPPPELIDKWVESTLRFDTIKTSRALPYSPPTGVF